MGRTDQRVVRGVNAMAIVGYLEQVKSSALRYNIDLSGACIYAILKHLLDCVERTGEYFSSGCGKRVVPIQATTSGVSSLIYPAALELFILIINKLIKPMATNTLSIRLVILALVASSAMGWWCTGHMLVAQIALLDLQANCKSFPFKFV